MATRKSPQNLEAEMSVLGSTFLSKSALQKVCEEITEEMFYSEQNRKLFNAIKSLYIANIPLDITTITDELDKKKSLNAVGGIEYISETIDSVATAANVDYYIKIVKEKAILRNLIDTANEIASDAYDNEDNINVVLDNAEKNILNVIKARQTSEFITIAEALKQAQVNLERLAQNKSEITGIPTGFYDLDIGTSGRHAWERMIIAAGRGRVTVVGA